MQARRRQRIFLLFPRFPYSVCCHQKRIFRPDTPAPSKFAPNAPRIYKGRDSERKLLSALSPMTILTFNPFLQERALPFDAKSLRVFSLYSPSGWRYLANVIPAKNHSRSNASGSRVRTIYYLVKIRREAKFS